MVRRNKKVNSTGETSIPQRSATTKLSHGTIKRNAISAPLELISTTNMLSYNAPDIYPKSASTSSVSSRSSGDDSASSPTSSVSTPFTSPDTSSINSSSSPTSPEPNHLSCYFGAPSSTSGSGDEAPSIPQRAPSHTKKSHEILSRSRSVAKMTSPGNSISQARSSINMFNHLSTSSEATDVHPFGSELAQVSEIAEEYGISKQKMDVIDEEEKELVSRGLFKFRAEDYMSDIHGLFLSAFGEGRPSMASMWI